MKIIPRPQFIILFFTLVTNLIEGLLGLRVILKLVNASTNAAFVRWIYETTEPLLTPFVGMLPSPKLTGGFVIEFSSLFALMVYSFIGYFAIEILEAMAQSSLRRQKSAEETDN
jgi:uncharacterized protein YggT (Ycf19 family)